MYEICYYPQPSSKVFVLIFASQITLLTLYICAKNSIRQMLSKMSKMTITVGSFIAVIFLKMVLFLVIFIGKESSSQSNKYFMDPVIKRQILQLFSNILTIMFYLFMFRLKLVQIQMDSLKDTIKTTMIKINGF